MVDGELLLEAVHRDLALGKDSAGVVQQDVESAAGLLQELGGKGPDAGRGREIELEEVHVGQVGDGGERGLGLGDAAAGEVELGACGGEGAGAGGAGAGGDARDDDDLALEICLAGVPDDLCGGGTGVAFAGEVIPGVDGGVARHCCWIVSFLNIIEAVR